MPVLADGPAQDSLTPHRMIEEERTMIRFTPLICPTCQAPARGTVERLTGVALLSEPDADGRVEYTGWTDVWWDEQRSVTDKRGRVRLICHAGHEWWAEIQEYSYELVETSAGPTASREPGGRGAAPDDAARAASTLRNS